MKIQIAICQFPTSADIKSNYQHISQLIREAKERNADIAHFSEACLSGYAGADLDSYVGYDWEMLRKYIKELLQLARELRIWIVLGSAHPLTPPNKPHNSLYIIDSHGTIVDRYDKRFCSGNASENSGDLAHYSPGDHLSIFEINGIRCGALICHDYRYPELYRAYKQQGVDLVFHSFHAAHISAERLKAMELEIGEENHGYSRGRTYPEITMPTTMIASAASNHIWISCPNSSARESCWGSFFVRADGVIMGQLERHSTGLLMSTVDTDLDLYDSTRAWRQRAMDGMLHSGNLVEDERSIDRTAL